MTKAKTVLVVFLLTALAACAVPTKQEREAELEKRWQVQRFTWTPQSTDEFGTLRVATGVSENKQDGRLMRMVALGRLDGEEFPTESLEDDKRIIKPLILELAKDRYCVESGIGKFGFYTAKRVLLDLNDLVSPFIFPQQVLPQDNVPILAIDTTYSRSQRTKIVGFTCNSRSHLEARRTHKRSAPQAGAKDQKQTPDQTTQSNPLSFPVLYW